MPPEVKKATFIRIFQSFKAHKLLPSPYLLVSKFSMKMSLFSYYYTFIIRGFTSILFCTILFANPKNCSICLQPLYNTFSVDVWGNSFHTAHEQEGVFCYSWVSGAAFWSSATTSRISGNESRRRRSKLLLPGCRKKSPSQKQEPATSRSAWVVRFVCRYLKCRYIIP